MSADIPIDVQQLLRECVESYEQLEVLLLFAAPGAAWTAEAASARLGMALPAVAEALECLGRAGALDKIDGAGEPRFAAAARWAGSIDALAPAYQSDRLGVMNLMTSNALERLRTSAIRAFASAFVVGKDRG